MNAQVSIYQILHEQPCGANALINYTNKMHNFELIYTSDEFLLYVLVFTYHLQGETIHQFLKNQMPLSVGYFL
jgi:hypothetical protein